MVCKVSDLTQSIRYARDHHRKTERNADAMSPAAGKLGEHKKWLTVRGAFSPVLGGGATSCQHKKKAPETRLPEAGAITYRRCQALGGKRAGMLAPILNLNSASTAWFPKVSVN
jgi:hypothetical protein